LNYGTNFEQGSKFGMAKVIISTYPLIKTSINLITFRLKPLKYEKIQVNMPNVYNPFVAFYLLFAK